ncbi:MAG: GNAT family N-acetyltransferase [Cytophagales bacterium]|nr:GNAT family N-acetyltransferase [Cytophagales bacterium]
MKSKYTFELTDNFLTKKEQAVFGDYLKFHQLHKNIWGVFSVMFQSKTASTKPYLLKAYVKSELAGVIILIQCRKYGRSLFRPSYLSGFIDLLKVPCYLWIKFGCCMDMMSNIGFVKDPEKTNEVIAEMIAFMKHRFLLTIITDYSENRNHYTFASELLALPHALIDTKNMSDINDYFKAHKNIKRKIRKLENKGGTMEVVSPPLADNEIKSIKSCFMSTAENSVFYLPYQDLYLSAAVRVSKALLKNVHYFIVKLNEEIIGYQAAIITGKYLNALHGAFNRKRSSNFHAYDVLFVKMTEYAIAHKLDLVDFGAVINTTKQRMVNKTLQMSYFILSKYPVIRWLFNLLLRFTRVQSKSQLKFREH